MLLALGKGTMGELNPHAGEVRVTHTSAVSVSIEAVVNVTNPTPYSARIPYLNIHVVKNGTIVGDATVEDVVIVPGNNTNIPVSATWGPGVWDSSGLQIGRDLLSQYLSGYNTTVDLKFHDQSIPGQRLLCDALSKITITVAAPRVQLPGDDPDEEAHFIRGAVFHVFSSTAVFTLVSPLHYDTLYLDTVNATAYYNGSEEVGWIEYDESFAAPPGVSHTPKMPVDWSLGGAGYDAVKKALGGTLKLDAFAEVGIRLGNWRETVWYSGKGIGASIRI